MQPKLSSRAKYPRFWLAKVLAGCACVGFFAVGLADYRAFEALAVHVTGTVLSIHRESHATGRRGGRVSIERPEVRFTLPANGTHLAREIKATAKVMSRRSFAVGDQVSLEFDPQRPEETVRVESGLAIPDIAFGVVGLALIYFGLSQRWHWRQMVQLTTPTAPHSAKSAAASAPVSAGDRA
jgi:hypothetical protein